MNSLGVSAHSYDKISNNILCLEKKLMNFKNSKLGQILHVDKIRFLRPGHILYLCSIRPKMFLILLPGQLFPSDNTQTNP